MGCMGLILFNRPKTLEKRRSLRSIVPEPEQHLWYFIRNKNIQGKKFRRQYSVGPYILDFYCSELKLALEIDGDSHFTENAQIYDQERTEFLNECGITVLRYTNGEVMQNINGVLQSISKAINR